MESKYSYKNEASIVYHYEGVLMGEMRLNEGGSEGAVIESFSIWVKLPRYMV